MRCNVSGAMLCAAAAVNIYLFASVAIVHGEMLYAAGQCCVGPSSLSVRCLALPWQCWLNVVVEVCDRPHGHKRSVDGLNQSARGDESRRSDNKAADATPQHQVSANSPLIS